MRSQRVEPSFNNVQKMSHQPKKRSPSSPKKKKTVSPVTADVVETEKPKEEDLVEEIEEESTSGSGMSFSCPQCKSMFANSLRLDEHMGKHANGMICSLCGYEGSSKEAIGGHERSHRNRNTLQCLICKERVVEEKQFTKHMSRHLLTMKSCPWCQYMGEGVSALKQHIDYHLNQFRVDCNFCNYFSYSEEDLQLHSELHSSEKTFGARAQTVRKVEGMTSEETKAGGESGSEEPELRDECKSELDKLLKRALIRCCLCGRELKSERQLSEHMAKHMHPGTSYCPYCTYQTTDREQIFHHVINHLHSPQQ